MTRGLLPDFEFVTWHTNLTYKWEPFNFPSFSQFPVSITIACLPHHFPSSSLSPVSLVVTVLPPIQEYQLCELYLRSTSKPLELILWALTVISFLLPVPRNPLIATTLTMWINSAFNFPTIRVIIMRFHRRSLPCELTMRLTTELCKIMSCGPIHYEHPPTLQLCELDFGWLRWSTVN